MPSQVPFRPQVAGASTLHMPRGSSAPRAASVHLPVWPGSAQDMHAPPQSLSQQTPSEQKPLLQSAFVVQLATEEHTPPMQGLPPQSAGVAHLVEHDAVVASHGNGAHERAAAGTHAP